MTKTSADPASWKGPRGYRMAPCSREVKMLRPLCGQCEDAVGGSKYLPHGWWNDCEHDPYISYVEKPVTRPVTEEQEDGSKKLTGTETTLVPEARPNWVSITHAGGMNKGRGVDKGLRRGYIYPQQLKSELFPDGIKRRCQFRECYSEDLTQYRNGWFCREDEAKLVAVSDNEETYQISGIGGRSDKLQRQQIDSMVVS